MSRSELCNICKITDPAQICYGCLTVFNAIAMDEKTVAERKWAAPKLAANPQQPCGIGLFGDSMNQLELDVEMFMDPQNPP